MRRHFLQVADVANMISFAILLHIFMQHCLPRNSLNHVEGLKDGAAIPAATAQIIHFSASWAPDERVNESRDIERVNIVPHLFSFISKDAVLLALQIALYEIAQKTM